MDLMLYITLNPLDWRAWPFAVLILLVVILRLAIPWPPGRALRVVQEVLIILPAVLLYFLVRGVVASGYDIAVRHSEQIIEFEKWLGIYVEPELQAALLRTSWMTDLVNWVYIWAHWPVILTTVLWLVLRHTDRYPVYRNALLISGMVGMIIFALYPAAPPRLMPDLDVVDTVTVHSNSYRVLQPPALTNPYAAMPSLHFGWNLLMGIALYRESSRLLARVVGVAIPVAMFLAIVLSANHFILDGIVGGTLVLLSLGVATLIARSGTISSFAGQILQPSPTLAGENRAMSGKPTRPHAIRVPDSPALDLERPFVVAHRFGNTLEGQEIATRSGADIVEADVWLHRGRLEVRHSKTLGPVPVLWDRWSLSRGWAPRVQLSDLLGAVGPDTTLMLDLKGRNPALGEKVIATLNEHHRDQAVLICSQNWDQVDRFRDQPNTGLVYSIGNAWQLRRAWQRIVLGDWQAVSIQVRLLDEQVVSALKSKVGIVMTWPVNTSERLEQVLNWRVDGFTSDDLGLITSFVAGRSSGTSRITHLDTVRRDVS